MQKSRWGPIATIALGLALALATATTTATARNSNCNHDANNQVAVNPLQEVTATNPGSVVGNANMVAAFGNQPAEVNFNSNLTCSNAALCVAEVNIENSALPAIVADDMPGIDETTARQENNASILNNNPAAMPNTGGHLQANNGSNGTETCLGVGANNTPNAATQARFVSFGPAQHLLC